MPVNMLNAKLIVIDMTIFPSRSLQSSKEDSCVCVHACMHTCALKERRDWESEDYAGWKGCEGKAKSVWGFEWCRNAVWVDYCVDMF